MRTQEEGRKEAPLEVGQFDVQVKLIVYSSSLSIHPLYSKSMTVRPTSQPLQPFFFLILLPFPMPLYGGQRGQQMAMATTDPLLTSLILLDNCWRRRRQASSHQSSGRGGVHLDGHNVAGSGGAVQWWRARVGHARQGTAPPLRSLCRDDSGLGSVGNE
uniref:Uncharacterized protein B1642C07.39 n=1 Tax=Oryza sativa subsp. japonica TaxID=39947 RepID=Q5F1Y2_ORYSJ|nr:hypothetical protein [Oryza sativa Japonica Group]